MSDPLEIKCRMMAELLGVALYSDKGNCPDDTVRMYSIWPRGFYSVARGWDTTIHCVTWARAIEALQTMRNVDEI